MKDSIGLMGITTIVIVFIFLFAGYMSMSVNQTKAYNMKNEVIHIIEKHTGITDKTIAEIDYFLAEEGYRSLGSCESDEYALLPDGAKSIDALTLGGKGIACIRVFTGTGYEERHQFPVTRYYRVRVFYSLDVPIVNSILNLSLTGSTKTIYYPAECPAASDANTCALQLN